jgi:hypothetical protein
LFSYIFFRAVTPDYRNQNPSQTLSSSTGRIAFNASNSDLR